MRSMIFVTILCAAATVGWAASAETKDPKASAGQYVDMAPVALPVISHGRLVNYVFVTLRLMLRPSADTVRMREKEPYFRDALVRLAARTPLNRPNDLTHMDEGAIRSNMMAMSARIVGSGTVTSVIVTRQASQHAIIPQTPAPPGVVEP